MAEPILKIPKIVESQWFDTLHDGLRFFKRIPVITGQIFGIFKIGSAIFEKNSRNGTTEKNAAKISLN
jgi:hypothetical protein